MRKHGLTATDLQNLPRAIQTPLMVYEWGEKAKSQVVVTGIEHGTQRITVAIKLERGGQHVEVNEVASVHGKDREWFKLVPRQKKVGKKTAADPGVLKQLKIIKEVFAGCEEIVVATDAGRAGELIFRYIYNYLHCRTPFRRLWISSLTDRAIQEGFTRLRPGSEYDNLNTSAECRSQADWMVGLNASQALAIAAHGNYSLGRVQTPTLKMICERYLENKNFVPQPYWQLLVETEKKRCEAAGMVG